MFRPTLAKLFSVAVIFVTPGCAAEMGMLEASDDMLNNKYLSVSPFPNSGALYNGSWTTNMSGGLISIRIYPDGTAKYCQNKMNGTVERVYAKIYQDADGKLYLISESGTRYRFDDYSNEHINTTAYGYKYKFITGVKSINCEEFLYE